MTMRSPTRRVMLSIAGDYARGTAVSGGAAREQRIESRSGAHVGPVSAGSGT